MNMLSCGDAAQTRLSFGQTCGSQRAPIDKHTSRAHAKCTLLSALSLAYKQKADSLLTIGEESVNLIADE